MTEANHVPGVPVNSFLMQELQSVFGLTDSVSAGVLDLSVSSAYTRRREDSLTNSGVKLSLRVLQDSTEQRVCYAAAHMVIIRSHGDPHQTVLQGHCQPISCLTTSEDRSVIATADIGPNSLMVLWDAKTATPFWSVSKPQPYGIVAMHLTPNGRQLVAMSALAPDSTLVQQVITIWDLSSPSQTPVFSAKIPSGERKNCLCLSPDGQELITNGRGHVCFWSLTSSSVCLATSPTRRLEFKRATGDFTTSQYLADGLQVDFRRRHKEKQPALSKHMQHCL